MRSQTPGIIRWSCLSAIFCFFALFSPFTSAEPPRSAYPTETVCPTPLSSVPGPKGQSWPIQEQWVWDERICLGKVANLSLSPKRPGGRSSHCDWKKFAEAVKEEQPLPQGWSKNSASFHVLSPEFLQTVLFHEPFRSTYTQYGLRLRCAMFIEPVDISEGDFKHSLQLTQSYFSAGFRANRLKIGGFFSVNGSWFFRDF